MEERTAKRIAIEYEDASTKEISKGFVAQFIEIGEINETIIDMVGMKGRDLKLLIYAVVGAGARLGLLGDDL